MMSTVRRPYVLLLTAMLLLATLAPGAAPAAGGQPPDLPGSPLPGTGGPWVVRAYYDDRQMVDALAAVLEPWEVHHDEGWLLIDAGPREIQVLLDLGFRLELDAVRTAELVAPRVPLEGQLAGIPGYPCYRTVEETYASAAALAAAHPGLVTWTDVGDSWEKATSTEPDLPGYDLWVLRLTNSALPGPKPKLFLLASIHAREYAPAELATRFAEHLVGSYGLDADVTWLLDHHEVHLVLQGNPDGRKIAEGGTLWRKNTDNDDGCTDPNRWGTDLNRNYEFAWGCCGGSSSDPCRETYRGPVSASEPETATVQAYVRAQYPDQRLPDLAAAAPVTATGVFVDLHSYGELVLWPWGFTETQAPNGAALQTLGRKMAYWNSYTPEQASEMYFTDGTTDDFAYGDLGLAGYTIEVGSKFFEDCTRFEGEILPDNLPALIYAAKAARTPYQTPAGPDVRDISLVPATPDRASTIEVLATLDDTRYSAANGVEPVQSITAGELYVDVPPWVEDAITIPQALLPVDGTFDTSVEAVQASVSTAGLAPGRHVLYLRGRDADGHWGAFSAIFLDIAGYTLHLPLVGQQSTAE
jgi:carboxypeptidase T